MKFKVYYLREVDGRAPAVVSFDEYDLAGEVAAESRNMVIPRIVHMPSDDEDLGQKFEYKRPIGVGDLIVDEADVAWIYTPLCVWAQVETVST